MSDNLAIQLLNVSKEYSRNSMRIPVLQGLNLDVRQGEFLALMGPSGSGKTTLLNLIAGLDRATSGDVNVDGLNLSQLSESQLTRWRADHIGFIFEEMESFLARVLEHCQ